MARYVDSLSILGECRSAETLRRTLSRLFENHAMTFEVDTDVILNDLGTEEKEPEPADSAEQALSRITAWPSLGGTQYTMAGHKVSVFLYGVTDKCVDVIAISVSANAYLTKPQLKEAFDALITDTHRVFKARRTISEYELLSPNSIWLQELKRVRDNNFEGKYSIDLRSTETGRTETPSE